MREETVNVALLGSVKLCLIDAIRSIPCLLKVSPNGDTGYFEGNSRERLC